MEDVCIIYNVIEIFLYKKNNQDKNRSLKGPFGLLKLQMALAQLSKNTSTFFCRHLNTSITKGKN
jgi:hypothetical protein